MWRQFYPNMALKDFYNIREEELDKNLIPARINNIKWYGHERHKNNCNCKEIHCMQE